MQCSDRENASEKVCSQLGSRHLNAGPLGASDARESLPRFFTPAPAAGYRADREPAAVSKVGWGRRERPPRAQVDGTPVVDWWDEGWRHQLPVDHHWIRVVSASSSFLFSAWSTSVSLISLPFVLIGKERKEKEKKINDTRKKKTGKKKTHRWQCAVNVHALLLLLLLLDLHLGLTDIIPHRRSRPRLLLIIIMRSGGGIRVLRGI